MHPIIEVNQLSKKFNRGAKKQGYKTLRDVLSHPLQAIRSTNAVPTIDFNALNDVSFNVKQGDVVGIIGRNGAGKSTLLKVISRILAPSSGSVTLRGRVGSLLEVGTGFHPELTGRENVFMNGAILGMSRKEIRSKFDEIVSFAGMEDFIDTPTKRYSSGMSMRLAFAVAAHLEPEILIIDEVLAVGDVRFQKKCLGKMSEISQQGRTILFVSHNMTAIRNLCNRCLLMEKGQLILDDPTVEEAIKQYLQHNESLQNAVWLNDGAVLMDDPAITPLKMEITSNGQPIGSSVSADKDLDVSIEFDLKITTSGLMLGFALFDQEGNHIFHTMCTDYIDQDSDYFKIGINRLTARLPSNILGDGEYLLTMIIGISGERAILWMENNTVAIKLNIQGNIYRSTYWAEQRPTIIAPVIKWDYEHVK